MSSEEAAASVSTKDNNRNASNELLKNTEGENTTDNTADNNNNNRIPDHTDDNSRENSNGIDQDESASGPPSALPGVAGAGDTSLTGDDNDNIHNSVNNTAEQTTEKIVDATNVNNNEANETQSQKNIRTMHNDLFPFVEAEANVIENSGICPLHATEETEKYPNEKYPVEKYPFVHRLFALGSGFAYGCAQATLLALFATKHASEGAKALLEQIKQYTTNWKTLTLLHDDFTVWIIACDDAEFAENLTLTMNFKTVGNKTQTAAPQEQSEKSNEDGDDENNKDGKIADSDTDDEEEEEVEPESLLLDSSQSLDDIFFSVNLGHAYFLVDRNHLHESCRRRPGVGSSGMALFEIADVGFPIGLLVGCAVDNSNLLIFANFRYLFRALVLFGVRRVVCPQCDHSKTLEGRLRADKIELWEETTPATVFVRKLGLKADDDVHRLRCATVLAKCLDAQLTINQYNNNNINKNEKNKTFSDIVNKAADETTNDLVGKFGAWCTAIKKFADFFDDKNQDRETTLKNPVDKKVLSTLNFKVDDDLELKTAKETEEICHLNNYDVAAVCYTIWNQDFIKITGKNEIRVCYAGDADSKKGADTKSADTKGADNKDEKRQFTFMYSNVGNFCDLVFALLFDQNHSNITGKYKGASYPDIGKTHNSDCINPSQETMLDAYNGAHVIPELPGSKGRVWSIATYEDAKTLAADLPDKIILFPFSKIPYTDEAAINFMKANKDARADIHQWRLTACHHPIQCEGNEVADTKKERKKNDGITKHPAHICVRPSHLMRAGRNKHYTTVNKH